MTGSFFLASESGAPVFSIVDRQFSALGTVLQQLLGVDGTHLLPSAEGRLFERAVQYGIAPADFYATRKIASLARCPSPLLLTVLLCEKLASGDGNTYLNIETEALAARFVSLGFESEEANEMARQVPAMIASEPDLFGTATPSMPQAAPFIVNANGTELYRHSFHVAEQSISIELGKCLKRPWARHDRLEQAFERIVSQFPAGSRPWTDEDGIGAAPISLAPEQLAAAMTAVHAPLTFISGGPGTGKTSIVLTILRLLAELGVAPGAIQLAAPTGRAANRIGESLERGFGTLAPEARCDAWRAQLPAPKTVHRLLGWSPHRNQFNHGPFNPLSAEWLIIDESSMLDVLMAERLLLAMKPGARLIMLGDADQLPSVDAGAVFRDVTSHARPAPGTARLESLIADLDDRRRVAGSGSPEARLAAHVVQLQRTFRQSDDFGGRHVRAVAAACNRMDSNALLDACGEDAIRVLNPDTLPPPLDGVSSLDPTDCSLLDLVDLLRHRFYEPYRDLARRTYTSLESDTESISRMFRTLDEMRLLCLTHRGTFGVETLNQLFKERIFRGEGPFLPGAPWMVTRNDYRQGLFNGDIGVSLWFASPEGGAARWLVFRTETGFRRIPFGNQVGLTPAYATTVHKSQGSEAGHVVLVLPERKNALCRKELIYTAVTRAKKSVLIYGSRQVLRGAVEESMERASGLRRNLVRTLATGAEERH